MKAETLFRFRLPVFLLLYALGLWAPWDRSRGGSLWLAAATLLARSVGVSVGFATLVVTVLALASLLAGSLLRVWGTAYLGAGPMRGAALRGQGLVAAGPYAHVRNPLYLAACLQALGVSILMPVAGAVFFLPAFAGFVLFLIAVEERFLAGSPHAQDYGEYRRLVPRLLPRLRSRIVRAAARPGWLGALLAEIFPISFAACFAVFAWRYNTRILIQCLLVCYGMSLVVRAFLRES